MTTLSSPSTTYRRCRRRPTGGAQRSSAGRLDYWTLILGPTFSKKERAKLNLSRFYAISQIASMLARAGRSLCQDPAL
jgi:hypothetical protein